MAEMRNSYENLVGKSRCRWEDNIRTDLREIGRNFGIVFIWLRTGTSGGPL
jgi:hypothetical protein